MTTDRSLPWRTSSYTGNANGSCVEVALTSGEVQVRDTKDRSGGAQLYGRPAWVAFLRDVDGHSRS